MIEFIDFETFSQHIQLGQKDKIRILGQNISHKCLRREFNTESKFFNCIEHEASKFV